MRTFRLCACGLLLAVSLASRQTVSGQQPAEQSIKGFHAEPGLEGRLWAAEPAITNPTNIAIDERGRVWVLEAVNYRRLLRGQPDIRPAGDRIVILEDRDADGRADKTTVFDQSPDLRAPLGIAVLGDRVIVSQSPDLIVYTKDAADRIVKKEVLLTGWGGIDHDHGLHAVVFGPDGRYYFNAGNEGFDVTDRSGHRVRSPKPGGFRGPAEAREPGDYLEGAVMSVAPDGTGLQVLAQNFRNPYEVALDSFGNIWQTDNDDDGNAWTRATYVMEGGNYGFRGPLARTWREDAGSHFHEELPGVVPNLLRLGPGSPCGLLVYEGMLLPPAQRGQLLHAEAGRRLIARYPIESAGAGYTTRVEEVVFGGNETWFRPSDVAVAPDGAVYIADWYDPAVGGHGMGDAEGARGRIYRLAPPAHVSRAPRIDLHSKEGVTSAFRSPSQAVFFLGRQELVRRGRESVPLLAEMTKSGDAVLRARALWLLNDLGDEGSRYVREAIADPDARFRVLGLRLLRRTGADLIKATQSMLHDTSPQVRREIALLLQDPRRMTPPYLVGPQIAPAPELLSALSELALQYDGEDRWYLEALGIAARGREDALYAALRPRVPAWTATWGRLLWELRAPASLGYLADTLKNATLDVAVRRAALDVVAAMESPDAAGLVVAYATDEATPAPLAHRALAHVRRQTFSMWPQLRGRPELDALVRKGLATADLQPLAVELATALGDD